MTWDSVLQTVSVVLTLATAGVGIEFSIRPPTSNSAKVAYRAIFVVCAGLLVIADLWQHVRAESEKTQLKQAADAAQKLSDQRSDQLQGKLDGITTLISHPPQA